LDKENVWNLEQDSRLGTGFTVIGEYLRIIGECQRIGGIG